MVRAENAVNTRVRSARAVTAAAWVVAGPASGDLPSSSADDSECVESGGLSPAGYEPEPRWQGQLGQADTAPASVWSLQVAPLNLLWRAQTFVDKLSLCAALQLVTEPASAWSLQVVQVAK